MFTFVPLLGTLPPAWMKFSNSNASTASCVKIHSLIKSFVLVSTAAQSNTSVCIDAALLLRQHVCVLRGRGALMRQDYENQSPSPSRKAEAWLSAYRPVLIRLTRCDNGRIWYTKEDAAGHVVMAPDSHTWRRLTPSVDVHAFCYLWCRAWLAILPMLQSFGPADGPAWVMWAFLPLATNNSSTTVTLSNGDDWTRSWLTAELLAG